MKLSEGTKYICNLAKTNYYTTGKEYLLVKQNGMFGFIADDGLFDVLGMTWSTLTPKEKIKNNGDKTLKLVDK